ncbi:MAG: T9SS type B sorting domain-containing protein, partial [Sphingobacteriales bacterium]
NADYQSCPGSNWFNTQAITTTGTDGWSGNAQATSPCPGGAGYGSTQWVTAGRAMPQLAGRDNVRFRFRFAAGNRCNSYDGFAVDNIWIGEVQPLSAEFTYKCSSDRSGQFTPATIGCGSNYSWNFGDPASGSANTTTGVSPVHTFSSAGDYLVTLTVNTSTGGASTITKPVRVLDANVQVVTPVGCVGDSNGVLSVQASPAGSYTYGWSTDPVQTGVSASGLPSGNYSVEIRGTNVCTVRAAGTLTDPVPLAHTQTVSDARCTGPNGKAAILPTGGTGPYSFSWSPAGGSSASSAVLVPGDYTVAISDAHGCPDTARFTIGDNSGLPLTLGRDTVLCAGETLLLVPAPGPFTSFTWQDGRNTPDYRVVQTGSYSVRVADADGCSASASVKVTVDCSDVFFPSAFTPNGDGRNDYFGPLGNRSALSEYSLKVFGRWGQVVFETTNPFGRWNGNTTSGKDGSQVYVWVARYRLVRHDGVQTRKGTITLVR